jgi:Response regulator containing a CheY-like receiver domain and an HTH DNA-binding domain
MPIVHITNNRLDQKITQRECEVLRLLANGNSTQEISKQLNISINTIETHRRHLLEKFEAKNVAELIKKASKVFWLE